MRLLITGWQGQLARSLVEAAAVRPEITALALGRPALDPVSYTHLTLPTNREV